MANYNIENNHLNINNLCFKLEEKSCGFVTYKEDINWYVVTVKYPFISEIFIVTKQCCEDKEKTDKRLKEILDYLRSKKLI